MLYKEHFIRLLQRCRKERDILQAKNVLTSMRERNLESHPLLGNYAVSVLVDCGGLQDAQHVFDVLSAHHYQNEYSWTSLISGYIYSGDLLYALHLYHKMQEEPHCLQPNNITFLVLLNGCTGLKDVASGRIIHSAIVARGIEKNLFDNSAVIGNTLVHMYGKCECHLEARQVFDRLPKRNLVSWNALISGCVDCGLAYEAGNYISNMLVEGISPDPVTFVCSLKICDTMDDGGVVHIEIVKRGFEKELHVSNSLVSMYAECGSIYEAQEVFIRLPIRNRVSWNALIAAYSEHGSCEEAWSLLERMQQEGLTPDSTTIFCSLKVCSISQSLEIGRKLHAEAAKMGLDHELYVGNMLVDMYVKCTSLAEAHQIFDGLPVPDAVSWDALIAGYVELGVYEEVHNCYERMKKTVVLLDATKFVSILRSCGACADAQTGQEIHSEAVKRGVERELYVGNTLVSLYINCNLFLEAQNVFCSLPVQDAVSWDALEAGYNNPLLRNESRNYLQEMQVEGISPDPFTFVGRLRASAALESLATGYELHTEIVKRGFESGIYLITALVNMYSEFGSLAEMQQVFASSSVYGTALWNVMIAAFADYGHIDKAILYFHQMKLENFSYDEISFVCILKACGRMAASKNGLELHAEITMKGYDENPLVGNSLLDLYLKNGFYNEAWKLFDILPVQDAVSWAELIAGCYKCMFYEEVLSCFNKMLLEDLLPDTSTLVVCLKSCAILEDLDMVRKVHIEIMKRGLEKCLIINDALVDTYVRFNLASEVYGWFNWYIAVLPTWQLPTIGDAEELLDNALSSCLQFFQQQGKQIPVSYAILICSLKTCGFSGALETGRQIHVELIKRGLGMDTYTGAMLMFMYIECGFLEETHKVFEMLPHRDAHAWSVLTGGYSIHGLNEEVLHCYKQMQQENVHIGSIEMLYSLKACGTEGIVETGKEFHAELTKLGLEEDLHVGNALLDMYANCGSFKEAFKVFEGLPGRDAVSWHAVNSGFTKHELGMDILDYFEKMQLDSISPDNFVFVCCLKNAGTVQVGERMHAEVIRRGLEGELNVCNAMMNMYTKSGSFAEAQQVFLQLPVHSVAIWNSLIALYMEEDFGEKLEDCYQQMQLEGISPDSMTFVGMIKGGIPMGFSEAGQRMHAELVKRGFEIEPQVEIILVDMYAKYGFIEDARQICIQSLSQNSVVWNPLLREYLAHGLANEVFDCLKWIQWEGILPDCIMLVCCLKACGIIQSIEAIHHTHAEIIKRGLEGDLYARSTLVDVYMKCNLLAEVHQVFSDLPAGSTVLWNAFIGGYIEIGLSKEAAHYFQQMEQEAVISNSLTLVWGLKACGINEDLVLGQKINAQIVMRGMDSESDALKALVEMYFQNNALAEAHQAVNGAAAQDSDIWASFLVGYCNKGLDAEVLDCFNCMKLMNKYIDAGTFTC